jgi:HEAT repeat protein
MTDAKYGSAEEIMAMPAAKLVALLRDPAASTYAKAKACQQLAVTGDKSAVPALAALLTDAQLSHYARVAMEPNPDPSVDQALRSALSKVKGKQLAGVITSIGYRKDTKAINALAKLRGDADPDVAKAADSALARIRPAL